MTDRSYRCVAALLCRRSKVSGSCWMAVAVGACVRFREEAAGLEVRLLLRLLREEAAELKVGHQAS